MFTSLLCSSWILLVIGKIYWFSISSVTGSLVSNLYSFSFPSNLIVILSLFCRLIFFPVILFVDPSDLFFFVSCASMIFVFSRFPRFPLARFCQIALPLQTIIACGFCSLTFEIRFSLLCVNTTDFFVLAFGRSGDVFFYVSVCLLLSLVECSASRRVFNLLTLSVAFRCVGSTVFGTPKSYSFIISPRCFL